MTITTLLLLLATAVLTTAEGRIDLATVQQEYISYLRAFGKSLDRLSDPQRVEQFLSQLQIIHTHNEKKTEDGTKASSFNLQLNVMSDMLPAEVNQLFGYRNHKKNKHHTAEHSPKHDKSLRKMNHKDKEDESYYHSNLYPFFGRKNKAKAKEVVLSNTVVPESINWSNDNNPIGSSVMSSVRNQGTCGACWAFVAVATAEAALRISLSESSKTTEKTLKMPGAMEPAHIVQTQGYTMYQSSILLNNNTVSYGTVQGGPVHENIANYQPASGALGSQTPNRRQNRSSLLKSSFPLDLSSPPRLAWIPSLSVQQLVDCDTSFNRGCSGGSPLYAFRFIASKGLVPWSRYEYEEKVDTCNVKKATILPVAKYFIRDYGKVPMLDSAALMVAVSKGPVALGVCGTDPHFMLYSNGVFDLDTCCTDQNHAITLVGYGYDEATGLDYWLAQNSWGKLWGESGYIKLKRTEVVGQPGICGMLANPMYGTGGYILDEKGHFIDPSTSPHYPGYVTDMEHWMQDNWREMMVLISGWLLCISLMILLYACYIERLMYLHAQLRAANDGYTTIEDEDDNLIL